MAAANLTLHEIPVTDMYGFRIGQTENTAAGTGCTVVISPAGMRAGIDIRGGGPASRETPLLNPLMAADSIHAVVLSGGSAFGLGASDGVMAYLEERNIGIDVGVTKVPLVVQSDIFDLTVGDSTVRPDKRMGYDAARAAMEAPNYRDGNYGAGCGATVGKYAGMETCMKSGIGSYALQIGDLKVGAIVVVNALGDVYDWKTGKQVAGLLTEDKSALRCTGDLMKTSYAVVDNKFTGTAQPHRSSSSDISGAHSASTTFTGNTTLGVVMTNALFNKAQLCKIAGMAQDGYARSIHPVHTSVDGDSIYALSCGDLAADQDLVGTLAAEVVSESILRAVRSASSAYGYPSVSEVTH